MWFRFPKGAERITIERQEFASEWTDAEGWNYFRAPAHFSPRILGLGAGFIVVADPKDMPADLPREDPERDNAIVALTAQLTARDDEIAGMRSDLIALRSELAARSAEVANLKTDLANARVEIQNLKDEKEDELLIPPEMLVKPPAPNGSKKA